MPFPYSSNNPIRGRKPKDKATRNRAPSESQNRLSKDISKSSDEGDKSRSQPTVSPFDYILQNETFINEAEQLPPLPDSIPTTPSSSIVLPDKTHVAETEQKNRSPYQPSIEDEVDESTPTPTPQPSAEEKSEWIGKEPLATKTAESRLHALDKRTTGEKQTRLHDNSNAQASERSTTFNPEKQRKEGESRLPVEKDTVTPTINKEQIPVPLSSKTRNESAFEAPSLEMVQKPYRPPSRAATFTQSSERLPSMSPPIEPIPTCKYSYASVEAPRPTSPQMPGGFPTASGALGSPQPRPASVASSRLRERRPSIDPTHITQQYGYPPQSYYSRESFYAQPYHNMPFYPSNAESLERRGSGRGRRGRPDQDDATASQVQQNTPNIGPDISHLLDEYRAVQSRLDAKERQSQEVEKSLKREIEDLKRQLDAHRSEFAKVLNSTIVERNKERNESAKLRVDKDTLTKELDQATIQISILRADLGQTLTDRDQLRNECSSLRDETAGLQKSVHERDSLRSEVNSLHDRRRGDADALTNTQKDRDALVITKKTLEQDLEGLRKEIASQRNTHEQRLATEQESSRKELVSQRSIHEQRFAAEQESWKKQVDSLRSDLRSQKEQHERSLAEEKEKARKQQESLSSEMVAQKGVHERAITEEQEKRGKEVATKEETIRRMGFDHKVELSRVTGEVSDLRKKYNFQCHELDNWRLYEVEQRRKVERAERELREAREKHLDEIKSLQKRFDEDDSKRGQQADEEIQRLHRDHASREREWKRELETLRAQLAATKSDVHHAVDVQNVLVQDKQNERARRLQVTESLHRMEDILAQLSSEKGKLNQTLQALGHASDLKSEGNDFP